MNGVLVNTATIAELLQANPCANWLLLDTTLRAIV